ncbi:MAG TPA: hypothetical protein VFW24_07150, partial [Acidimicrobiales bacterium]|nr:hypothetical protein [Acidimicrobiales bacterium]
MARRPPRWRFGLLVAVVPILAALLPGPGTSVASAAGVACSLNLSPPSGPVGTLVTITGSTAGCRSGGGELGFIDEGAGIGIGEMPQSGPFAFRFRVPDSMPTGNWFAAAQSYAGGGPVAPGPGDFAVTMGANLQARFLVTWARPGWADFTSVISTPAGCPTCYRFSSGGFDLLRAGGFIRTFYGAPTSVGYAGDVGLAAPVVAAAFTPDGGGYWMLAADGGVFTYGNARFFGSAATNHLPYPFVGIAATPDG